MDAVRKIEDDKSAYSIAALAAVASLGTIGMLERAPYERQTGKKKAAA